MVMSLFPPGCLAGLLLMATSVPAAELPRADVLQLDSKRSSAAFSVKVLWMIPVEGQFGNVRGQVVVDRFRSQARVDAWIDADGVTMRRTGYENWVKSAEFFDVGRHPEIHFQSESFPLSRLRLGGDLPGSLTMRGTKQPVLFQLLPSDCERLAIDCPVEASGTVRRSEFGMRTRRATLSDKVELSFSIHILEAGENASQE